MSEVLKQLPIRFPKHESMSIWFFSQTRRSSPLFRMNMQNNQVYLSTTVRKCDISASRLLHACPTFSHSVMVSVTISKSGSTLLVFVKARTKIEKKCWWSYCSLPDSQSTDDAVHVFQQDISHLLIMHIEQWSCFNWDSQTHCSHHVASQQPDLNAVE